MKGMRLITVGAACIAVGACDRPAVEHAPAAVAATRAAVGPPLPAAPADPMELAEALVAGYLDQCGELPATDWARHAFGEGPPIQDRWGCDLRYTLIDARTFEIRSAGPDRTFDTDDDLLDPASAARELVARVAREARVSPPPPEDPAPLARPFELEGDRLGTSLQAFKSAHHRPLPDGAATIPWCSDEAPGKEIISLLAEAWHARARIVSCRLTMPYEDLRGRSTVAGIRTKNLLYHFVDGQLYLITIWIDHADYAGLRDVAVARYGEPTSTSTVPRRSSRGAGYDAQLLTWDNGVSRITLEERSARLGTSAMIFVHHELLSRARSREPGTIQAGR